MSRRWVQGLLAAAFSSLRFVMSRSFIFITVVRVGRSTALRAAPEAGVRHDSATSGRRNELVSASMRRRGASRGASPAQRQREVQATIYRVLHSGVRVAGAHKSKIAADLFGIFLVWLGIHKLYLGYAAPGVIMPFVKLSAGSSSFQAWQLP